MKITNDDAGIAANTLFRQAYTHSVSVIFGYTADPHAEDHPEIRGGSAGIVVFNGRTCAVTCAHVLQGFTEAQRTQPLFRFQIGNLHIDPFVNLRDSDAILDLAVIDLSQSDLTRLNDRSDHPVQALRPTRWPSPHVAPGDTVVLCGFPGETREFDVPDRSILSPAFPIVEGVQSVDSDGFVLSFERRDWVNTTTDAPAPEWVQQADLGGLSGAPVFSMRNPMGAVGVLEFVGTVLSALPFGDGLRVRSSTRLSSDGLIIH